MNRKDVLVVADPGEKLRIRARAANIALVSAFGLMTIKIAVGLWSNSVSLFSEGIHSGLDFASAALAFFTIREAGKPADPEHPFGHGKFETLSSLVESLLLVGASLVIGFQAISHVRNPEPLENAEYAIATIAFSLVVSYCVYRQNAKAALQTDSSAIEVNAIHFLADAVTAGGVLIALVLIHFTGALWIDPVIAFLIAVYILAISWGKILRSVNELIDSQLPAEEIARAESIFSRFKPRVLEVHDLRTRKSGSHRHFDYHALVCGKMSVIESHAICDEMEEAIEVEFPGSFVSIHVEPCTHPGRKRPASCSRSASGVCDGES